MTCDLYFTQVDVDGSGAVEWDEFCVLMYKKMREKDPENEIKEAFRQDRVVMVSRCDFLLL